MPRYFAAILLLGFAAQLPGAEPAPREFRCDTEVFVGQQKEPHLATVTLFTGRMVYDFQLTSPAEITIYDFSRSQITLLLPEQKQRLAMPVDDLLRLCAALKTMKAESELFRFCNQPTFMESLTGNTITLHGNCLEYRVEGTPSDQPDTVQAYREFADWSARLNVLSPGSLPPFARLEVNRSLASRNLLPRHVARTITTEQRGKARRDVSRSEHLFSWNLTATDRRRIENAEAQLASLEPITLKDYLASRSR